MAGVGHFKLGLLAILMTMQTRRRPLPDRARPGLHAEPLDVAIGQLLPPYCPSKSAIVIDGNDTTNTEQKLLALWYITAYAKLVKKDT